MNYTHEHLEIQKTLKRYIEENIRILRRSTR